jgi:hypothetical protein
MITKLHLTKPRELVFPDDEALDKSHEKWEKLWEEYGRTHDVSILPLKPGRQPTIFVVHPLTPKQFRHVENHSRPGDVILEPIAYAVHEIKNLRVEDEQGREVVWAWKREDSAYGQRLPDEVMTLFGDRDLALYLWAEIRKMNSLAKEAAKSNSPPVVDVRPKDGP